ncbi:hypothetical protein LJR168_002408 [Pseudoxanthomonas sp. LjRoot168]|uniref:hypothetical protein n=1 Tax=unclassified Pseudoxanthomonas TaxID=2645906 RepID=UPI003ED0EA8F
MPDSRAPYLPVNREFHDVLEATAMRRTAVEVRFLDDDGVMQRRTCRLVTLSARDGVERVALDSGEHVRLDRLVAVAGTALSDFPAPT